MEAVKIYKDVRDSAISLVIVVFAWWMADEVRQKKKDPTISLVGLTLGTKFLASLTGIKHLNVVSGVLAFQAAGSIFLNHIKKVPVKEVENKEIQNPKEKKSKNNLDKVSV